MLDKVEQVMQATAKALQNEIATGWFYTGPGPYQVVMSGQCPFGGSIQFNGVAIAEIHAVHYSTNDNTFADVLRRPENIPHFEAIKAMVKAANEGAK